MEAQYPEHVKLQAVKDQSQIIGEFLEHLGDQGLYICEQYQEHHLDPTGYMQASRTNEQIIARYFDIDLHKIRKEKEEMLDNIRRGNERERELND